MATRTTYCRLSGQYLEASWSLVLRVSFCSSASLVSNILILNNDRDDAEIDVLIPNMVVGEADHVDQKV